MTGRGGVTDPLVTMKARRKNKRNEAQIREYVL